MEGKNGYARNCHIAETGSWQRVETERSIFKRNSSELVAEVMLDRTMKNRTSALSPPPLFSCRVVPSINFPPLFGNLWARVYIVLFAGPSELGSRTPGPSRLEIISHRLDSFLFSGRFFKQNF